MPSSILISPTDRAGVQAAPFFAVCWEIDEPLACQRVASVVNDIHDPDTLFPGELNMEEHGVSRKDLRGFRRCRADKLTTVNSRAHRTRSGDVDGFRQQRTR